MNWLLYNSSVLFWLFIQRKNLVVKLQESFQQQLNESFGKSLHASLLKHSSSEAPRSTSETETQREKHRNTLKRMREFFMENCGTAAKKSCTYKGKEKDCCENTTAGEHWTVSVIAFETTQLRLWKGNHITMRHYLL